MRVDEGRVMPKLSAEQHGPLWASDPGDLTDAFVPGVVEEPAMGDCNVLLDGLCLPYLLWLGCRIVPHCAVMYNFTVHGVYGMASSIGARGKQYSFFVMKHSLEYIAVSHLDICSLPCTRASAWSLLGCEPVGYSAGTVPSVTV